MSSLWVLKAKEWPEDTRSEAVRNAEFYLRPGKYRVGRQANQCDIDVPEDKSISRSHATITIPSLVAWQREENPEPYVAIQDSSRYGTLVSSKNDLSPEGEVATEQRGHHRWLVRFGFQSPFR